MDYRVLLYYKYTTLDDPETFATEHLEFCKDLELKGRILVSTEGINGTVSGTVEATDKYMEQLKSDERFKGITFKVDEAEGHAFKKMHVRPREEIVALDLEDDVDPRELTGNYLSPKEFREALLADDTVVIDARNDYEYDLGHFRGSVRPDITRFRDLPDWIKENKEQFMDKKIVTYCTGGIRCEKFSGYLLKEGFEDVGQLEGGIATYGKDPEVKGELWDGKMYVFDERISVEVNQVDKTVVGKEWFDGTPCERYINCSNPECN
ncbi:MAG: oxygen-dependent tRNA uridine(34) hydroxylase TrhO, partial [Staphylococcus equorum]